MELRDYIRMLRRGWPIVAIVTAAFIGLASVYLVLAPKRYEATAVLFVSVGAADNVTELQQGVQFAGTAVRTYANLVGSAAVLTPVADNARPQLTVSDLSSMVTAGPRTEATLIDVTVTASSARQAADLANSVSASASSIIPTLQNGTGTADIRLTRVQRAVAPQVALSPDVKRVLALGGIVGLAVGLGLAIASQALDTRLRRSEDVRRLTDVPLLAVLPHLRRSQRQGVIVRDEPLGPAGEAYRSLRTNLSYLEFKDRRSILFTAAADDSDGAQVPVNLAWSIAQAGRRVLLVDLDLRESTVGEALGIRPGLGIADVLAGEVDVSDAICNTRQDTLDVLLSGTSQPSPSDLLSAPVMNTVLRGLEREYEYVILHAPPLLTYTDAAVVSHVTGWTLVTVAAGRTRAPDLDTALGTLANVRVTPLGLVLAGARGSAQDNRKIRGRWGRTRPNAPRAPLRAADGGWRDERPHRRSS